MSEPTADPATTPAAPPAAADAPTPADVASDGTLAALREDVKDLAGAVRGLLSGRAATPAAAGPDAGIGPEVAAEVKKLQDAEARAARAKGNVGRLDAVEAAVKKITERRPREFRRVTHFMGWPDKDDMQ